MNFRRWVIEKVKPVVTDVAECRLPGGGEGEEGGWKYGGVKPEENIPIYKQLRQAAGADLFASTQEKLSSAATSAVDTPPSAAEEALRGSRRGIQGMGKYANTKSEDMRREPYPMSPGTLLTPGQKAKKIGPQ